MLQGFSTWSSSRNMSQHSCRNLESEVVVLIEILKLVPARLRKSDAFSNAIPTYPYKSTVPQRVTLRQSVTWCSTEVIFWNAFRIVLANIAVDEDVRCLQVSWPCQVWFEIVIEDVVFVPCTHKQNEKRQNDTEKNTAEWRDRTLSWASDAAGSVSWKGTKWIFVNSGLEKSHVLHVVQVLFWMPTWHFLVLPRCDSNYANYSKLQTCCPNQQRPWYEESQASQIPDPKNLESRFQTTKVWRIVQRVFNGSQVSLSSVPVSHPMI